MSPVFPWSILWLSPPCWVLWWQQKWIHPLQLRPSLDLKVINFNPWCKHSPSPNSLIKEKQTRQLSPISFLDFAVKRTTFHSNAGFVGKYRPQKRRPKPLPNEYMLDDFFCIKTTFSNMSFKNDIFFTGLFISSIHLNIPCCLFKWRAQFFPSYPCTSIIYRNRGHSI